MEICGKRIREEISAPANKIFEEENLGIIKKGYDLVTNIPKYENVKSILCRERRQILGTFQNLAHSADI